MHFIISLIFNYPKLQNIGNKTDELQSHSNQGNAQYNTMKSSFIRSFSHILKNLYSDQNSATSQGFAQKNSLMTASSAKSHQQLEKLLPKINSAVKFGQLYTHNTTFEIIPGELQNDRSYVAAQNQKFFKRGIEIGIWFNK